MHHPPFFTWTEETYSQQSDVPEKLRAQIRVLWLKGARTDELAATFKLPLAWVEDFALDTTKPPRLN